MIGAVQFIDRAAFNEMPRLIDLAVYLPRWIVFRRCGRGASGVLFGKQAQLAQGRLELGADLTSVEWLSVCLTPLPTLPGRHADLESFGGLFLR